jgi:hypothetical protein
MARLGFGKLINKLKVKHWLLDIWKIISLISIMVGWVKAVSFSHPGDFLFGKLSFQFYKYLWFMILSFIVLYPAWNVKLIKIDFWYFNRFWSFLHFVLPKQSANIMKTFSVIKEKLEKFWPYKNLTFHNHWL